MTDRPYTDDDLRAEAARQHKKLTEDPDFMGIGEQMGDASVVHTDDGETSLTWQELLVPEGGGSWDAFDAAQRKIHDLINGAADVSDWAVALGADGLEPDGHTLQLGASDGSDSDDEPTVRLHFAFHPDMEAADRDRFVVQLSKVVLRNL
ncbi:MULTISPECIES: hypothetical protein [Streptomyces]|uniref:hypothetical protein n=1 Tax=Streptomyces TaxID=1883 RepID=UPI000F7A5677|nr:hypothetical protein [Streptomyces sp. WAC05858]RSS39457.1 hypothetical protein EF902_27610 [Streptomyces sp. WAC05858]WTA79278.1 hypothetical protein OG751_04395 [Streptomyces antimycoticus]